jgi:hypothetical protein
VSRSPLAYPLNRSTDLDGGGAADLQTDIMRFMAILSLCLVAIFALVQSLPLTAAVPATGTQTADNTTQTEARVSEPEEANKKAAPAKTQEPAAVSASKNIVLTRPKWVPKFKPVEKSPPAPPGEKASEHPVAAIVPVASPPPPEPADGFTLRFESDAALMRAVAAGQVGVYAIGDNRAQRMAVSNSRISFWDASTPNSFHEMESSTVPTAVSSALKRAATAGSVRWGVTLPGKMTTQLDSLMQANSGGSLIIGADGRIRLEPL